MFIENSNMEKNICCGGDPQSPASTACGEKTSEEQPSCSCGQAGEGPQLSPTGDADWITGTVEHAGFHIPVVSTALTRADRAGAWRIRWGIGRYSYRVPSGLYAAGTPDAHSPVFVTANYKLSFDHLRSNLAGYDGWILVLDTKGINVWCAAGKGTFGTRELITRMARCSLERIVSHRTLILPQLGATGVQGQVVKQFTGFRVVWGPVRAADIPAFLENGMKASPEMRRVRFPLRDRLVLIPLEMVIGLKYALPVAAVMLLGAGWGRDGFSLARLVSQGVPNAALLLTVYLTGAASTPLFLPWLPGRAFALKGFLAGVLLTVPVIIFSLMIQDFFLNRMQLAAWMLLIPAATSFLGMNFTGASTYTSLSGVLKEMKIAMPLQAIAAFLGLALWIGSLFIG